MEEKKVSMRSMGIQVMHPNKTLYTSIKDCTYHDTVTHKSSPKRVIGIIAIFLIKFFVSIAISAVLCYLVMSAISGVELDDYLATMTGLLIALIIILVFTLVFEIVPSNPYE